jgi:TolB-like protein/class 3 adenylate cyclase/Flp pilus assembly protein TadD
MNELNRRLAGILAADVVGYSAMIGADEPGTLARVRALRTDVVESQVATHGGRLFKTTGDGFFAAFASAVQALRCAIAIQETLGAHPDGLRLRIGVHQGEVVPEGDDLLGDGVIIAARLEPLAEPGGICISARVREDAAGKLQITVQHLGTPDLKNIAQPVRVYRVRLGLPERPALALPDKPSLVVLPFENMSGDAEQEYFADGMVEDITTALSRIRALFVIARNSAFTYKGRAVDVRQIGRELGVRYVLEGSVRKVGSRVRITGQLVDAATRAHLWADHFDGAFEDIFDLQDRVTSSVCGIVEPSLQGAEIERAQRKATEDLGAYDYFLRGMASFHQATASGERMRDAQALFAKAFALDECYGTAYGMAAWCICFQKANNQLAASAPMIAEGVRLAHLAAANGRDDAASLWSAGHALALLAGALDAGALLTERACVLNPNSALAWNAVGIVNIYLGNLAIAITNFERAMRLSPVDPFLFQFQSGIAMSYFMSGQYDEALAWAERAVGEQPNWHAALRVRSAAYALSGRMEDARHAMAELRQVAPLMCLSGARDWMGPFRRPEHTARYIDGLRLAGLPE